MSYTIGLDFGTHQTKVCIEDATNPAQKIYEFFEFDTPEGDKTVFLPSIIQINEDETLSYGFIDESKCKIMPFENTEKPILKLPQEPKLISIPKPTTIPYPPKPKNDNLRGASIKEQLQFKQDFPKLIKKWETECIIIDEKNEKRTEDWELECNANRIDYEFDLEEYNREIEILTNRYNSMTLQWEAYNLPQKQIFRYFKLATFSNQFWKLKIKPEIISVWYLTYILFKLQEKFGNEFYTQMGVPFSMNKLNAEKQKQTALKILISANLLLSEYKTPDHFLKEKYTNLLQKTELFDYSEEDVVDFGLNIIPEAFAGLWSLTQQRRLERGMHLLVDIGGGTSDIAFFTITEDALPNIHAIISFPQGLNYIFENHMASNGIRSIEEAQYEFVNNHMEFNDSIMKYQTLLINNTKAILEKVEKEFINRQPIHKIHISELKKALQNKPVVYCGGGSTYNCMIIALESFTDKKLITKDLLNIPYIKNRNLTDSMFPILATSYGLSIQIENNIEMTPVENIFDHLPLHENNKISRRFSDYEHGLSDT